MEQENSMKLTFERTFNAPIDLVFDVLTKQEHLKNWNCPSGMTISFAESNVSVGGNFRIGLLMDNADGTEMMFIGKFLVIDRPHRLVYTQAFSPGKGAPLTQESTITIDLKQEGSQTQMNFIQTGFTSKREVKGGEYAWKSIMEKLAHYVQTLT